MKRFSLWILIREFERGAVFVGARPIQQLDAEWRKLAARFERFQA